MTSKLIKSLVHLALPGLTALAICAPLAVLIVRFCTLPDYETAHNAVLTSRTLRMLKTLAFDIQLPAKYLKISLPQDAKSLLPFFEEARPGITEDLYSQWGWLDSQTGVFIDSWGRPLRLLVESPNHYRLLSLGPNGYNENGKGDDVVYDFDPLELRDAKRPNETKANDKNYAPCP